MITLRPLPENYKAYPLNYLIISWFHSGRIRPASGSWGSLATLPVAWLVMSLAGWSGLLIFAALVGVIGTFAVRKYLATSGHPDPSEVVIDETFGVALYALCVPFSLGWWIAGFIFFRIFDMVKRGPVGWCDRKIKGATGVMMDDAIAGLMAGALVMLLNALF